MPSLEKLYQEFKDDPFLLVAIDMNESKEKVRRYINEHGISYINLLDRDGRVSSNYNVTSTPMKFLIDKEGNMVGAALGYRDWNREEVRDLITELM